eukprot:Blabericola_migrator_1__10781@NODE_618_length_7250_cov_441_437282_g451_i0_p3_GENE_NODE_618_length_7250_cov_441_437282_g451_i0NODE_618_length_7250_cov_441_437282_g451_i0_p3_ORF_typecomplete_len504_score101_61_NODE_618_length_7250_cov_441_437282_g451_i029564467
MRSVVIAGEQSHDRIGLAVLCAASVLVDGSRNSRTTNKLFDAGALAASEQAKKRYEEVAEANLKSLKIAKRLYRYTPQRGQQKGDMKLTKGDDDDEMLKMQESDTTAYEPAEMGAVLCRILSTSQPKARTMLHDLTATIAALAAGWFTALKRLRQDCSEKRVMLTNVNEVNTHFFRLIHKSMSASERSYVEYVAANVKVGPASLNLVPHLADLLQIVSGAAAGQNDSEGTSMTHEAAAEMLETELGSLLGSGSQRSNDKNLNKLHKLASLLTKYNLWSRAKTSFPDLTEVMQSLTHAGQTATAEAHLLIASKIVLNHFVKAWEASDSHLEAEGGSHKVRWTVPPPAWRYWKALMLGYLKGVFPDSVLPQLRDATDKLKATAFHPFINLLSGSMTPLEYEWERWLPTGLALSLRGFEPKDGTVVTGNVKLGLRNKRQIRLPALWDNLVLREPVVLVRNAGDAGGMLVSLASVGDQWRPADTDTVVPELQKGTEAEAETARTLTF